MPIERPGRYGKQLVSHLGRRYGGEWSTETGSGTVSLGDGEAVLRSGPDHLEIVLRCTGEAVDRLQTVLGGHLARFVGRPDLTVDWT